MLNRVNVIVMTLPYKMKAESKLVFLLNFYVEIQAYIFAHSGFILFQEGGSKTTRGRVETPPQAQGNSNGSYATPERKVLGTSNGRSQETPEAHTLGATNGSHRAVPDASGFRSSEALPKLTREGSPAKKQVSCKSMLQARHCESLDYT